MRYLILLGGTTIADVTGTEFAYEVFKKTCELGELLNQEVELVDYMTCEVVESTDEDEDDDLADDIDLSLSDVDRFEC